MHSTPPTLPEATRTEPASASGKAPAPSRRGATIGRYVVLDILGRGGMGIVYSAFDETLDRKVAIKVLHHRTSRANDSDAAHERLLREAQAMARLSHPNVVAVHDVGTFEGLVFVAMEYVEGSTLRQWLAGPHGWRERLALVETAGRGLAAAHRAGLVHRDFKPDNVLVGRDGRARVTDFGLARVEPSDSAAQASAMAEVTGDRLTLTGSILGTVGFMAPEQAFGEESDARSDQFSFCVTLHLALYGEKPFAGADLVTYTEALRSPPREPPRASKAPPRLRQVLKKGMSFDAGDRYPSMDALLADLTRDPAAARRRWLVLGLLGTGIAVAAGGVGRFAREKNLACGTSAEMARTWDDTVREEIREAFLATKVPTAAGSFARTAAVLDTYAGAWASMDAEICEARNLRRTQPEDVRRLRSDCLDRRKEELRALLALFRRADAGVVAASVDAAYGLTSVSRCADVKELRASAGLPDDPTKRATVLAARAELAEAASLQLGGKHRAALVVAERALAKARAAAHGATESEALLRMGHLKMSLMEFEQGSDLSAQAALTAVASGNDVVAIEAAALEATALGSRLRRDAEARPWMGLAQSSLKRMGGNEELGALLLGTEARLYQGSGHRPDLALPLNQGAVDTYRRLLGVHPRTMTELTSLGTSYELLGDDDHAYDAYRASLAMSERLYGPDSVATSGLLDAVGDLERKRGDIVLSDRHLAQSLAIAERIENEFRTVEALQSLAHAANRSGDFAQALAFGERASSLTDGGLVVAHRRDFTWLVAPSSFHTGDALIALGRPADALPNCDRAIEAQERGGDIDPEKIYYYDALRCRGEALLAMGRTREALPPLERSVALPRRDWRGNLARARFALARALFAHHEDTSRARALAEQARDELAPLPDLRWELAAVDEWISAHPIVAREAHR